MRRSSAPSQRVLGVVPATTPVTSATARSVTTTAGTSPVKRKHANDSDCENSSKRQCKASSPITPPNKSSKSSDDATSTSTDGEISRQNHDDMILSILKRPFKVPFADPDRANASGLSLAKLGVRRAVMRTHLHDPEEEGALVLYEPEKLAFDADPKLQKVHVVVDPLLGKILRPHQREGVKTMYDCVTGVIIPNAFGCILADDMGLGKTLQTVTLIWTLLKQGPDATPSCKNAMVVAPATLVPNWKNEVIKWLGQRLMVIAVEGAGKDQVRSQLSDFVASSTSIRRQQPVVLVISYETARINVDLLNTCQLGLMLCDEGHRLKNTQSQTYEALNKLKVERRVIISGTPIQNDLNEYFALVDFACPKLLGTPAEFRKNYEGPITRGRLSDATEKEILLGKERNQQLIDLVSKVTIRRTNTLNMKYLPVKVEMVVCCRLNPAQRQLYDLILKSKSVKQLLNGQSAAALSSILLLRQLCNHPALIADKLGDLEEAAAAKEILKTMMPSTNGKKQQFRPELSGKFELLDQMLAWMKSTTNDRVVLISNFTQTLDLFESLCQLRNYQYVKLDGSLTIKARQKLIDAFNAPDSKIFAFLLSSKAGGCGLNLIGANRLILFDIDWNPSTDAQAKARCWRDGQKKKCYTYTFVSTGTMEEKILQRQAHKNALSASVVDEMEDVERHFSRDNLRDLFSVKPDTLSDTHDQLQCRRCIGGVMLGRPQAASQGEAEKEAEKGADLVHWDHFTKIDRIPDPILTKCKTQCVSFVFHRQYGV